MSRKNTFLRDLSRSHEAVHTLAEYYRSCGYKVEEHTKENQILGDLDVSFDGGESFNLEVKYDIMAARTGNLCFELSNGNKETGIITTKSDYVCYVVPRKGKKIAYVFKTSDLQKFIKDPANVTIKNGGDKKKFILALCSIEKIREHEVLDQEFEIAYI